MQDTISTPRSGTETTAKRIVVIDDDASYSAALAFAFDIENGVEVVGQASSATEGFDVALELEPDLVLCDYRMDDGNGIDCAARLRDSGFGGEIVILTGYAAPNIHADAAQLDDVRVISKDLPIGNIIETVNTSNALTTSAPASEAELDDLILEQMVVAEAGPQSSPVNRIRKLIAAASVIAVLAIAAVLLLTGSRLAGTTSSNGLERPFVTVDGTTSEVRVTVHIDGVPTDPFVPANLPITVAIDTDTPATDVAVLVENLDDSGTAACTIGVAKDVLVANTAAAQANATCATTIN